MSTRILLLMALTLAIALVACDDETGPDNERFVATMSGANELPSPISTSATGTAEFEVEDDGSVSYEIEVQSMTGVVAAHIHGPASTTQNAGVLVSLFPIASSPATPTSSVSGQLVQGSFRDVERQGVTLDSLLVLMRSGNTYVNVHTAAHGAGEIRGQLAPR